MHSPEISVIVPVYNVRDFLHKSVDSILSQTFTNFELLLIDDGSTDGSSEICDAYATADPRVRVFHKPNGGVSSARNLGLDNARAPWIAFFDPDDYLDSNYLENYQEGIAEGYDIIIQGFKEISIKGSVNGYNCGREVLQGDDMNLKVLKFMSNQLICFVWNKLFKSSLIESNRVRFNTDISLGEDTLFVLQYLENCRNLLILPFTDYNYVRHSVSACYKDHPFKSIFTYTSKVHDFYIKYLDCQDKNAVMRLNWNFLLALDGVRLMYKQGCDKSSRISFLRNLKSQKKQLRGCGISLDSSNKLLGALVANLPVQLLDFSLKSIVSAKRIACKQ